MNNSKIGIITITYNSEPVLVPFMECILQQSHTNFVLYVIDNISQDNTRKILERYDDPRIHLIYNNANVGVAAGNNQGIKKAIEEKCDYLLILNNDVEFESTLLEKLLYYALEKGYALITPKMMHYYDKSLIWYAGSKFNKLKGYMAAHIGLREKDNGQYNVLKEMDYTPTCCVLVKKEVIEDVGLMDEKYFAYYDDTDFFYRIYKHGKHKLIYCPDFEFYHKVGQLSKSKSGTVQKFKFGDFHIKLTTRNKVYYLRKQSSLIAWINIIYFYFRLNLRFFLSGKYHINWKTFKLIQTSFLEGLKMSLSHNKNSISLKS